MNTFISHPFSQQNVTGYYVPRNNVVNKTVNQKLYSGVPNSAGGGGGGGSNKMWV